MNSHFFSVCKSDKCTVDTKIHEFTSSNLNFVRYYFPMETKCTITKQIMEILLTFDCSCTRCASGSNTTETSSLRCMFVVSRANHSFPHVFRFSRRRLESVYVRECEWVVVILLPACDVVSLLPGGLVAGAEEVILVPGAPARCPHFFRRRVKVP